MASLSTLSLFLISLTLTLLPTPPTAGEDTPTVYEVLQKYNFPVGLLPKGITQYELDESTGEFKVYLGDENCEFYVQDYKLRYKSTISGVISTDRIKDLKGVSVKVLILWLNIGEITRDDDDLEFSVGIVSADFGIENFDESPQCGCGFDCDSVAERNEKNVEGYLNHFSFLFNH